MSEQDASSDGGSQKETGRKSEEGASGYLPSLLPYDVRRPPFELIMRLQQERSSILAEVSRESQERDWFRQQLSATQKKIQQELEKQASGSSSPFRDGSTDSPVTNSVLEQLQSEASRVTDGLRSRFGSEEEIEQRYQDRLRRIHHLELTMLRLQQASSEDLSDSTQTKNSQEKEEEQEIDKKEEGDAKAKGDTAETESENSKEKVRAYVTTATQTSPADLSFDLPEVLLREGLSPLDPEAERNVSSAGQTCKLEVVYSLLSMLGTHDTEDLSRTLLAMTSSQDSCHAMRQSGCLPLLIQLLHGCAEGPLASGSSRGRGSRAARKRATKALRNLVASNPEERAGRREMRVLRLLEQLRAHCDSEAEAAEEEGSEDSPRSTGEAPSGKEDTAAPGSAVSALMKLSFDPEHHSAICALGGLQAIADLLRVEHERSPTPAELPTSITTRRFACMALTNLTFGDGANKALLCSLRPQLEALVGQLEAGSEELGQVAASVLRNLSWRADLNSKRALREVHAPARLTRASMRVRKEQTLRAVLSALWNLSAHCTENKADICAVEGALPFLVTTLSYKSPSKTLAVIENGGGILRNISSVIALREDYRECLRVSSCLPLLLRHLRSPSLTVVSNACGTLWNLSASCARDQQSLWELGAVPMLRALMHSKHKMISMGCASALKNLMNARPHLALTGPLPGDVTSLGGHRKAKGRLEAAVNEVTSSSSTSTSRAASTASAPGTSGAGGTSGLTASGVPRSRSNDSVHSDQTYDRLRHNAQMGLPLLPSSFSPTSSTDNAGLTLSGRYLTCPHGDWLSVTRGIEQLSSAEQHRLSTATNEEQELRTFCTEGTPYGVSTAASVSDLCAEREETQNGPPPAPSTTTAEQQSAGRAVADAASVVRPSGRRFSRHRASVASGDGNESDANSEKPQDFGSRFGEGTAPVATGASGGLPAVSPRTYAVEDTPLTGGASRCSSLSSISELEELRSGAAKAKPSAACPAPALPPAAGPPAALDHPLERIEERASSEARETAAAPAAGAGDGRKKTVTFVMAQQLANYGPGLAEETPLMFSRSSSLSSLGSSLGGRSLHSSVVSDYSRSRNSEAVSPSELPDSPTAERKAPPGEEDEPKEEEVLEAKEPPLEVEGKESEERRLSSGSSCSADVTDRLLSLVIQSAMPPKPPSGQTGAGKMARKEQTPREPIRSDCVTLYAMEDTPLGFSTMASSLSDLTVDSHARQAPAQPQPPTSNPTSRPPTAPLSPRAPSSARSSSRSGVRTADTNGSSSYGPVVYATEGTPALYSYNSPLSSLFLSPLSTGANASPAPVRAASASASVAPAVATGKGSASSLSSLSLDSVGFDRSLLEECISSALPKVPRASAGQQRSAGVGAPAAAGPTRSCTMPALQFRTLPLSRSRRDSLQQQFQTAQQLQQQQQQREGGSCRISRKDSLQQQQQQQREIVQTTSSSKLRHLPHQLEAAAAAAAVAASAQPSVQHQRSRSAGAAGGRSDLKASRLPLPAAVAPNAANFWSSAPLSPPAKGRRKSRRANAVPTAPEEGVGAAAAPSTASASAAAAAAAAVVAKERRKKEGSLNFLFDCSGAGSERSDAQKARPVPEPLSAGGACVGTASMRPQRRALEDSDEEFPLLKMWDDFEMDVTEAALEIDASGWPKAPLSDPLGPSRPPHLLGEGLDDISVSSLSIASSLASSPVAIVPPRARIVKPPAITVPSPAVTAPARPVGVRGGGGGRKAVLRSPAVRLTRTAAQRLGVKAKEENNNEKEAAVAVRCRPKNSLTAGRKVDRTTRLIEPSELLIASAGLLSSSPQPMDRPVTSLKSADRPVTSPKPVNRSITVPKAVNRSAASPKSVNRSVTSPKPTNRSVTSPKPTNRSVTSPKPTNRSVTSPKPTTRSVTSPKPTNRSVTSPRPINRSVTSPQHGPKPVNRSMTSPRPVDRSVAPSTTSYKSSSLPKPKIQSVLSPKPNRRDVTPSKPKPKTVTSQKQNNNAPSSARDLSVTPLRALQSPKLSRVKPVTPSHSVNKNDSMTSSPRQPMSGKNDSLTSSPRQPINSTDSGLGSSESGVWISREEVAPASVRASKPSSRVAPFCRREPLTEEQEAKKAETPTTQGVLPSL